MTLLFFCVVFFDVCVLVSLICRKRVDFKKKKKLFQIDNVVLLVLLFFFMVVAD